MNYCRKCQSDYEKPGTCNCFAPTQAAPLPSVWPQVVPYYPYSPPSYPWGTIIIGDYPAPAASTFTITWNGPITSNSVNFEQAAKSYAGGSFTAAGGSC